MSRITIGRQSRPRVARTARALAALAVLIAGSTAWAQEVRIGYVDMKVLFDTAPQIDSAREALDQEFTPRNEAVVADEVRLERMEADLAAAENLSAEERYEM
jgi:outer membrane protein